MVYMELFLKILCLVLVLALFAGLCLMLAGGSFAAPPVPDQSPTVEIPSLCEAEADLLVRSAAAASRGNSRTEASYAARVGIIATVLNRMADSRFPDSAVRVISADRTFSRTAPAGIFSEEELALTRSALNAALRGLDPTDGALYFSTPDTWVNRFAVTCEIGGYSFGVPQG